jgi:GT2 family glycosyltransferase
MEEVFSALFAQTFVGFTAVAVICGNADGGKEFLAQRFPKVRIIDPGKNIGFAGGNNLAFRTVDSEYYQLLNPDLILEPTYIEQMLTAFTDTAVGAATGKLLRYDALRKAKTNILDTTGLVMRPSGRPYDRGQGEEDAGQYDAHTDVFGCSGAGVMLRRRALEVVQYQGSSDRTVEFFDETFHTYWEDVDLCWRMQQAGFVSRFVPTARAFHVRSVKQSDSESYLRHYYGISRPVRRNIVANYFFTFIKNSHAWPLAFWKRAIAIVGFVALADWPSLVALARVVRHLPEMVRKRKYIARTRLHHS